MIVAINDPFGIDITYNWEERDKLEAITLKFETEQHFLELARRIRESLMAIPLSVPPEDMDRVRLEQSFLRGKYELLIDLVNGSKEAKVQQSLI